MLDDFFIRATLAAALAALTAGPLGCFVVWRRMAFVGDAMSHAALLGVAGAIAAGLAPSWGVFAAAFLSAGLFLLLRRAQETTADSTLSVISHGGLAFGLIALGFLGGGVRIDLMAYLFGDVLAVGRGDLYALAVGAALGLAILGVIWRPLLAATVDADMARASGVRVALVEAAFAALLAGLAAAAMKIVGVLLVTALLVIPASAARRLAATPEGMAALAAAGGVASAVIGLQASWRWDLPAGPAIVAAAIGLFAISRLSPRRG